MITIATHNGSAVRQAHNIRAAYCAEKEAHIDLSKPHEVWIHETVEDAYHRLFDSALAEYNEKQTRDDRKIQNYLSEIQKDEKKHPCYEMIIGIYGVEVDDDEAKEIMKSFVDGWKDRNPNLELIGAYYHADEQGKQAHVHLDYIPVAHGYKRGLETQTGLVKALGEMGIEKNGKMTAQIQWEARENAALEALCKERGMVIWHPQRGKGAEHLETRAYKAEKQLEKLNAEISEAHETALKAVRAKDKALAEADVQEAVKNALRGLNEPLESHIEIVAESPARKTLFGREMPETVTVRKEDFERAEDLRRVAKRAEQAVNALEKTANSMKKQAKTIRRNYRDSVEVAADERVRTAENTARQAEKVAEQTLKDKGLVEQQLQQVKMQLEEYQDMLAFLPEQWELIKKRTEKARELEKLYYAAQNGEQNDQIDKIWGNTRFKLSDGEEVGYRGLLEEYRKTCEENGLHHDVGMYEHLDQLNQSQSHDRGR